MAYNNTIIALSSKLQKVLQIIIQAQDLDSLLWKREEAKVEILKATKQYWLAFIEVFTKMTRQMVQQPSRVAIVRIEAAIRLLRRQTLLVSLKRTLRFSRWSNGSRVWAFRSVSMHCPRLFPSSWAHLLKLTVNCAKLQFSVFSDEICRFLLLTLKWATVGKAVMASNLGRKKPAEGIRATLDSLPLEWNQAWPVACLPETIGTRAKTWAFLATLTQDSFPSHQWMWVPTSNYLKWLVKMTFSLSLSTPKQWGRPTTNSWVKSVWWTTRIDLTLWLLVRN